MFHRFGRIIIMLIVSTALGMPQGHAQDARAAGEAAPAALARQSPGLEEALTLATTHTSAGWFAEGQQVLETALGTMPPRGSGRGRHPAGSARYHAPGPEPVPGGDRVF